MKEFIEWLLEPVPEFICATIGVLLGLGLFAGIMYLIECLN